MSIQLASLVFDFGMVVLIWIVQLVVYPGLKFYQKNDLIQWHKRYIIKIAYVVMPLMIGQLSLAIVKVFTMFSPDHLIILALITFVWISTFFQFLPMHNQISFGDSDDLILDQLIRKNWFRTVLLILVFLGNLYGFIG
ncbi:hypothetical protein U6A24_02435 [Aquimarina gracilis]|uniref:Uncharacterized protein n=1 Tax=Aquimarina gracilis TaxID=874422 RepID=A0ABU5ZRU8_9FLAO|nr:hypothetical protein [Aquimarina gracilis]MEB3344297.1 hypothetical protein [Aquimarina gracilis]